MVKYQNFGGKSTNKTLSEARGEIIFMFVIYLLLGFILGFCVNGLYNEYTTEPIYELKYKGYLQRNSTNSWVYIDISGMDIEEAYQTCRHEMSHELFADYCDDNWEKCLEVLE
jgi:hypothetical protein